MTLDDVDVPEELEALVEGSAETPVFEDEDQPVEAALREFFEEHDDVRKAAAAELYRANDDMTLGTAAHIADEHPPDMMKFLDEYGVERHHDEEAEAADREANADTAEEVFRR